MCYATLHPALTICPLVHKVHKGSHPGVLSIVYLPMIDLNPSDPVCIRSTLHYFADHASTHDVTPVVTFDQPLFYKAWQIIQSEPQESPLKKIVLKMGGLHTLMSFLGSIGHLMANTGLSEALETIHAKNTIDHMLSGKAIARAIRGHFIVDAVLTSFLLERGIQKYCTEKQTTPSPSEDIVNESEDQPGDAGLTAPSVDEVIGEMETVYHQLMDGEPFEYLCQSDTVKKNKTNLGN